MIYPFATPSIDRILHMSDYQAFTYAGNEMRTAMSSRLLVARATSRRIKGVVVSGDLTYGNQEGAFTRAAGQMDPLIAAIQFVAIGEGNHDLDAPETGTIDGAFPASARTYLTTFEKSPNSYGYVTLCGQRWGIATTEFDPRDSVLAWLSAVIAADASVPWIVGVHAYLAPSGALSSYGQNLWDKLIAANSNIKLVLCGHELAASTRAMHERADGSICYGLMYSQHATRAYGRTDPNQTNAEIAFDHHNGEYIVDHYSPEADVYTDGFRLPMAARTVGLSSFTATPATALASVNVLLPLDGAPDAFWDAVRVDGGDIRVTAQDGITRCAREIVGFDRAAKSGNLWVARGSATSLIVSAGNGLPDVAPDATYGRYSAWETAAKFVAHMEGLTDSTANAADITATTATLVDAKIAKGYQLNGSSDYLGVASSFGKPTTLTVMAWFKTTSTNAGIFGGSNAGPTVQPASYCPFISINSAGKVRGEFWQGSIGAITSAAAYNDGNWHHVALVGTGTSQELFVDGVSQGTRNGTLNLSWWAVSTIGTAYDEGARLGTNAWHYMAGTVDEVRVYSRALSATEIAQAFAIQNDASAFWALAAS